MRYKPKSILALHIALGGLPAKMRVEADPGIGVSATTAGELRKVTAWSEKLMITTPQERHPESAVKISKAICTHESSAGAGDLSLIHRPASPGHCALPDIAHGLC
jgi:hypothetical protein